MRKFIYKTMQAVCVLGLLSAGACNSFESEHLEWNTEADVTNPQDSLDNNMKYLFKAGSHSLPSLHNRLVDSYLDAATDDGVPTRYKGGDGSL